MSRTLHLFGTDWGAMMVPIQVIRWYRMQCYDGTDSGAIVVPIRRYCHLKTPSYPSHMDYSLIASLICIKVPTILLMRYIPSCSISLRRNGFICLCILTISTEHSSKFSKKRFNLTTRNILGSISTHISTSLPSFCSFLETVPKRRNDFTPKSFFSSSA